MHDSLTNPVDEPAVQRFETAWRSGSAPRIEDFLPAPQDPSYAGTLEELVHIELEFAWKSKASGATPPPAQVESYLARFPRLAEAEVARRLLVQEYRLRHRHADRPAGSEYATRFPHLFPNGLMPPESIEPDATAAMTGASESDAASEDDGDAPAAALPDLPGYHVLKVIGRGGMGIVLQARDLSLKRLVAIKIPLRGSLKKSETDRFLREARSAAKLRHPNVCPIYEVGEHRRRPYIAMGYIAGPTLQEWAKAQKPTGRQCAQMMGAVARAVAHAHEHGVVHRDIKPANILVEADGNVPVLTDFGLAKEVAAEESLVTQDGTVLGTPMYMSPEQAGGRTDLIGPAADVYSMGAVLYELLCGEPPFSGTIGSILKQVQSDPIVPLRKRVPTLHRDLETICLKALAREPRDRYTAAALADDLDRFAAGDAILARREGMARKAVRTLRRYPAQAASFAAVVALAVAAVVFFASGSARARQATDLRRQIESRVDAGAWSDDQLGEIDTLIEKLTPLDPAQASAQRLRTDQALAESVRTLLRKSTLSADVQSQVEHHIALLSPRAPELADALTVELAKRRRSWETVFLLEPPFANLAKWPAAYAVPRDGNELVFTPAESVIRTGYAALMLREPCLGNAQLEIVLRGDWAKAPLPVLVLDGAVGTWGGQGLPRVGHSFWISHPDDRAETFETVRASDGTVTAGCARDNVVLRTWTLKASSIAKGPLRMLAQREGSRLVLQINDLPPLEVDDPFVPPPRANPAYVAYLPPGARLERIRSGRQAQAVSPSLLERGDVLFQSNQIAEALAYYQEHAIGSAAAEGGQEARYKQGLCLLALSRVGDAERIFETLLSEKGDRWPALAGCQLLGQRIRQNRLADADPIFRTLRVRFPVEQLRPLVPHDVRMILMRDAVSRTSGLNSFATVTRQTADNLKQSVEIIRLLSPDDTINDLFNVMRAYEMAGLDDEALKYADTLLKEPPSRMLLNAFEHYGWMMRARGQVPEALKRLNSRLLEPSGAYRKDCVPLLTERARLHFSAGNLTQAEKDLDEYLRLTAGTPQPFGVDCAAAVMRGILRHDRGDTAGALADWRWGTLRKQLERNKLERISGLYGIDGFHASTLALIDGALAGELPEKEIETIVANSVDNQTGKIEEGQSTGSLAAFMTLYRTGVIDLPMSTFREMWLTPRGRQMAREVAFRTVPLPEMSRRSLTLGIYQTFRQGCLTSDPSEDQDVAFWETALMSCDAARDHKVGKEQFLKLFLTWKGTTGFLGWSGVQKSLDPTYRTSMAYIFARRCLVLRQPKDAAALFKQVVAESPPDSRLHRLAQEELKNLPV